VTAKTAAPLGALGELAGGGAILLNDLNTSTTRPRE